jgi:hypothetical protein
MNALWVTPRQLFEASRLADRLGPVLAQQLDDARVLLLMATRLDANGRAAPDLALELDRDGQVIATQYLDLRHRDDEDDGLADLADVEEPVPVPVDVSQARPAKPCSCTDPFAHDGFCARCGRTLREAAVAA